MIYSRGLHQGFSNKSLGSQERNFKSKKKKFKISA